MLLQPDHNLVTHPPITVEEGVLRVILYTLRVGLQAVCRQGQTDLLMLCLNRCVISFSSPRRKLFATFHGCEASLRVLLSGPHLSAPWEEDR